MMSSQSGFPARPKLGRLQTLLHGLDDLMLAALVLISIPVALLLVGMPFVIVAWAIAALAAMW